MENGRSAKPSQDGDEGSGIAVSPRIARVLRELEEDGYSGMASLRYKDGVVVALVLPREVKA